MNELQEETVQENATKSRFKIFKKFKKPSKNLFWTWIAYQSIKGTLTLSFIWAPLFYFWFFK